jgi:hypothetical protein
MKKNKNSSSPQGTIYTSILKMFKTRGLKRIFGYERGNNRGMEKAA